MTALHPIYFDERWIGAHGIGRFAAEMKARLPGVVPLRIAGAKLSPIDPLASSLAISLALAGKRQGCYFSPGFNPPLRSPIPFAFTIHDLIHLRAPGESSLLRRAYYASVVRPAVRRAGKVLTVSEYSRREIVEWAGVDAAHVVVAGNGVSAAFTPGPPSSAPGRHFLHVGRRASHKNIERLLQAFQRCRAGPMHRLLFTGTADEPTLAIARGLGIAERIGFAGNVSDEQLAQLYRDAVALVFPSLYEGFGLPIVEAMACGTAVITADATSTGEIAGRDNALLVDPHDTDALAQAMDRVAEDAPLRERLAQRGALRAREFSWERVARRVQQVLGSLS
jgi:glycosyltransferase involved in cell wall biosynthesis